MENSKKGKKHSLVINLLLLAIVIALAVIPLYISKGAEFGGADDKAKSAITELDTDYKPWFSSIWEPPSTEIQSLLFSLQAALGAGVIGYGLGYMRGKSKR